MSRSAVRSSVVAAFAIGWVAAGVDAAILGTLTNPQFDTFDGSTFDTTPNGWQEGAAFADGVGIWENSWLTTNNTNWPVGSGAGALGLTFDQLTLTHRNLTYAFQSLGVIDASDVGHQLSLTIQAQGRRNNGPYTGTVTVAFRAGTSSGTGTGETWVPDLGTVVGDSGSRVISTPDAGSRPVLVDVPAATYTVSVADVGTELFAVISLQGTAGAGTGYKQFVLDNLEYSNQVPEPASVALIAAGGAFLGLRRRGV